MTRPLYEIVLCFPDRAETRLTDRPVTPGDTIRVAGNEWAVVLERAATDTRATAQYLCELIRDRSGEGQKLSG